MGQAVLGQGLLCLQGERTWAGPALQSLGMERGQPGHRGAGGGTFTQPTTHSPRSLTAAHSIAQRERAALTPVPHRCKCCKQTHRLQLGHRNEALCGDVEQELPIHQRLLLQPVPPTHPTASGSPSPERSGVGLELHSVALCHHEWHSPNAHPHSTPFGLPCEHHKEG